MADQSAEIISLLSETPLFKELPEDTLKTIASKIRREMQPKGTILYRKGDPGNQLYLIASGEVALLLPNGAEGQDSVVGILGQGEVLGEMALLTGEPRSVSVRLEASSEFYVLDKKDFETILQENPTIALHLSRLISRRLAITTEQGLGSLRKHALFHTKLFLVLSQLEEPKNSIFALNLAIAMMEQLRRKIVIIDLCLEDDSCLLASLGQPSKLPPSAALERLTLRETIQKLKKTHSSGIDIISIPGNLFASAGEREKAILFLNYLRYYYDYALIFASPLNWESAKFLSQESDSIYLTSLAQDPNRESIYQKILTHLSETKQNEVKLHEVLIVQDGKDSFVDFRRIRIGWNHAIDRAFDASRNPFEAILDTKTLRSIERLARFLGNLKIGLALGGGGALGYAICGILKVLEREKIYPDIIAGTSIGALMGAGYAKGLSPDELAQLAASTDKNWIRETIFWDLSLPRGGGFLGGVKLTRFLHHIFDDLDFKDMELPLTCVACDIQTGSEVALREGRVLDAIRASISIPVVFKPYFHQNRFLVDGGLVNPVPISTLMDMGADILIAVKIMHSPAERDYAVGFLGKKQAKKNAIGLFETFFRTINTMEHQIAASKMDLAHVTIHPKTPMYNWTDFDKASELIPTGELATEEVLPKIKALLPFFADYCATRLKK